MFIVARHRSEIENARDGKEVKEIAEGKCYGCPKVGEEEEASTSEPKVHACQSTRRQRGSVTDSGIFRDKIPKPASFMVKLKLVCVFDGCWYSCLFVCI